MSKKYLIIVMTFFISNIYSVQLTISTPGLVELGDNINFSPAAVNDAIIEIMTSNVTLDLGNRILSQGNATAGLAGIRISANLSNITIRNGTISGLTGNGITVNERCSNIKVSNVQVLTCGGIGINFVTTAGNPTEDCLVDTCKFISVTSTGVLVGAGSTNINITNSFFDQTANSLSAILLNGAAANRVSKCTISNNFIARCGSGITLNNSDNCLINNAKILNGSSTTTYDGIAIVGSSGAQANGNLINNCVVENCTTSGGAVAAIRVSQASQTVVTNCFVRFDQTAITTVRGYYFLNSSTNSLIENCIANQVRGTALLAGSVHGFNFVSNSNTILRSCQCIDTTVDGGGPATQGDGFRFETCSCFTIEDCQSAENNQDGFNNITCTDMVYSDCESFCNTRNGFTAGGGSHNVFENCVALTNVIGFSTSGTSHVCRACKAVTNTTGFTIVGGSSANVWCNNVASSNTTGFSNITTGATNSSIVGNKALNNTTFGFSNATGGSSSAWQNQAVLNGTNYGGASSPATQGPGTQADMGSNLTA